MDAVLSTGGCFAGHHGPRLHPPFVGNLCVDIFLLVGIVGWTVEVEQVPPLLAVCFVVFYLSDSSFVTVIGPFLRPSLLMKEKLNIYNVCEYHLFSI
jgi:hypothetical protein